MKKIVIKQANVVNEGSIRVLDVMISNQRIERIETNIDDSSAEEIRAEGLYLLPGMIDDQVHFREPGLTHKADIRSESVSAIAGGITSFMEMPNTIPNTLTLDLLEEKYAIAAQSSAANFSFYMGIGEANLDEALRIDNTKVCGITYDGLYFNNEHGIMANHPEFLEELFSRSDAMIALHSEDDAIIKRNLDRHLSIYGEDIPMACHPEIRSEEACLSATRRVLDISRKHGNRLHLFHISTAAEAALFDSDCKVRDKRITAEACVHHLWFSDEDYETKGSLIKWNPSVKRKEDRTGLIKGLLSHQLDFIATDHAPHTLREKMRIYTEAASGGPLVQHALPALLELYHRKIFSLEQVVEKTSHHVAEAYRMIDRGYIREGYYADLVLADLFSSWKVDQQNILYKCGWSPFNGQVFTSKILMTFVSGHLAYAFGKHFPERKGLRLEFEKDRL
jgi:dihydroorotase